MYKVSSPPVIDGQKDDLWDYVPRINNFFAIKGAKNELGVIYEKDPDNVLDAGPSFRVVYDDMYLYFYAETYDDTLHKDSMTPLPSNRAYNDDCFEIFLDGDYTRGTKYDGKTDGEIWFLPEEINILYHNDLMRGFEIKNIIWNQNIWKNSAGKKIGWNIEVAIPLSDIYLNPEKNKLFGMDLKYSDDDGNELNSKSTSPGTDREHNLRWSLDIDAHNPANFYTASLSSQFITNKIEINNVSILPKIDGEIDFLWNGVNEYPLNNYSNVLSLKKYSDANVSFKVVHTSASIYFLVVAEDDIFSAINQNEKENDSFVFIIDGDNHFGSTYDSNTTGFYLSFNAEGSLNPPKSINAISKVALDNIKYGAKKTASGWNVEVEIPKKDLLILDDVFGFELYFNDDDDGGDLKDCSISFRDNTFNAEINPSQLSKAVLKNQTVSVNDSEELPQKINLFQNYPNPFNPETVIHYSLPVEGFVSLNIYDILGRKILTLVDENKNAGSYSLALNMQKYSLSSGIYFAQLAFGGQIITKKMEFIK